MVKLVYCICRRLGSVRRSFSVTGRTLMALSVRNSWARKLVHRHALAVPGDSRPADFDGMAELWFDDLAALLRARQSSAWAASTADEAQFVDPAEHYFVTDRGTADRLTGSDGPSEPPGCLLPISPK